MTGKKLIFWVVGIIVLLAVMFLPKFFELKKLREANENIKKRIILLKEDNTALAEELDRMQEDPAYVEKKARQKLGIVKKGEYIYE